MTILQLAILFGILGAISAAKFEELPLFNYFTRRLSWARLPVDGSLRKALGRHGIFGQLVPSRLMAAEKFEILAAHLKYREKIHGANLLLMLSSADYVIIGCVASQNSFDFSNKNDATDATWDWDESLASLAQGQADRCLFGHDNLFFNNGTNVGQNVVAVSDRVSPWQIVQLFYMQSENYIYSSNTCKKGRNCEAYTQLVWYKTRKVGCGLQFCNSLQFSDSSNKFGWWNYVCDYSPPGNYPEHPFLPTTYKTCELCNLSPGTRCIKNQCQYCDSTFEPDCRPFNATLCRSDNDSCCKIWDRQFCIPNTRYFNYMALNCGATCDSYMCLF